MLNIEDLTYRLGPRLLFDHASAAVPLGAKVGFVGRNGAGKTTLFRLVSNEIYPEGGACSYPKAARIGRVEQEAPGGPGSLIDFVLLADVERAALLEEAEVATDPTRIADIQIRLADIDAHSAPARAGIILSGLGFDHEAQQRSLSEFSGGWRMRVALIEAINSYDGAIILVSHDRHLLEACADRLWLVGNGGVTEFDGDMDDYRKLILDSSSGKDRKPRKDGKAAKEAAPEAAIAPPRPVRSRKELYKKIDAAADRMTKFEGLAKRIDEALAKPGAFAKDPARAGQLAQQRAEVSRAIAAAEDEWLELQAELEGAS